MKTIYQRLNKILPIITDKRFRENKGLGNEIGYYIFDYDPEDEIIVREHIEFLKQKINDSNRGFIIREFDLYQIMLDILEDKGYLQKVFAMEREKGTEAILRPIKSTLRLALKNDLVVEYIKDRVEIDDVVLLTGIGKIWPLIRSHNILNGLHAVIDQTPLVMFYPGTLWEQELHLFNEFSDSNYYRAFRLVER